MFLKGSVKIGGVCIEQCLITQLGCFPSWRNLMSFIPGSDWELCGTKLNVNIEGFYKPYLYKPQNIVKKR